MLLESAADDDTLVAVREPDERRRHDAPVPGWEVSSEPVPESKNDASERPAEAADKGGKELNLGPVREHTRPPPSPARKPRRKLPRGEERGRSAAQGKFSAGSTAL